MSLKPVLSLLLVPAALALAACGSDSKSEESDKGSTPATAIKEIGETRDALTAALATYKSGDHQAAEDQAAEAYVQHFEEVEGPLGDKDAELNEKLEEAISQDVRNAMKDGKPAAEVEQTVDAVLADLEKAEAALR
jgi:high-affinity iron transporter